MAAHPHHRTPHRPAAGGVSLRLRWWALMLPVIAFGTLLAFLVGGGEADAAEPRPVSQLLWHVNQSLSH